MRRIAPALLALALAAPSSAQDVEPRFSCIALAKIADGAATQASMQDGDFAIPVEIRCENLDASEPPIRIETVEIDYVVDGTKEALKSRRFPIRELCGTEAEPLRLDVTVLTREQMRRPPFRGIGTAAHVEAMLTFRAHQRGGPHRRCFGTMKWEFDVRP